MAFLPLILDIADELTATPYRRNNFGRHIHPNELEIIADPGFLQALGIPRHQAECHYRPRCLRKANKCGDAADLAITGKDGFQLCMDVKDFAPNEISVKTVDDTIVVEGKHEERQDQHGYISRQFTRRYTLPDGYDAKDVVSQLSSDGVLTVKAPPQPKAIEGNNVRVIQIQQTGPAHLNVCNQEKNEKKENKENQENQEKME